MVGNKMNSSSTGAQFEILVDGRSRSWRDVQETAFEAARYLKEKNPHSDVTVRDARNGATVSVGSAKTPVAR
jgi:predicted Rdx family selenoprotein